MPEHGSDTEFKIHLKGDIAELLEEGMKFCLSIEEGKLVFSLMEE